MIKPFTHVGDDKDKDNAIEVNFNSFLSEDIVIKDDYSLKEKPKIKTNKRKRSKTKTMSDGNEVILADEDNNSDLPKYQSNEPYVDTYDETNNLLRMTLAQIDSISSDVKSDLDIIRNSKTLKSKYTHIPNLANTLSSLMNTKVTAIREMNTVLTNAHNLELKRVKELKLNTNEVDDDKYIMDLYNAFISAPVDNMVQMAPPIENMTLNNGINNIIRADVGDSNYSNYSANLTPVQNAMRYETNPDVKTVIVYDQSTGRRFFDVMNIRTGESIPNVPRPDPMFLEDCVLDINNKIARNSNLDKSYPIILIGDNLLKY